MKHVVTIAELHVLIPETLSLEGIKFKDTKQLIQSVIESVEQSGAWEYVQYISGNPSLFVVKQRELTQTYVAPQYNNAEEEIRNHYNTKTQSKSSKKVSSEKITKIIKESSNPLYNYDSLFKETTLPW